MIRFLAILFFLHALAAGRAQVLGNGQAWRYQLTEGAAWMDYCADCDRLSVWEQIRGSFDLEGTATPGVYLLKNIFFNETEASASSLQITGAGTLSLETGEPVLTLDVTVWRASVQENIHMTSVAPEFLRFFPMISAQADESPGSPLRTYRLRILAAPIRELWFSTSREITSARDGQLSGGDLLAQNGRVVKRNSQLTQRLTLPEGDVGLDAADVGPRGEIFFSAAIDAESIVNGPISHGDVVTSAGRVYLQSAQLLAKFGVNDPAAGLDAIQFVAEDEIYFSITKEIPRTGLQPLRRGDILSSKGTGRIVKTEANLYAAWVSSFSTSFGADSIYVWPSFEIWFSPEIDFINKDGLQISAGDLISDQGYVVYKNWDLVRAFGSPPPPVGSDAGLDALVVISDATAKTSVTQILELNPVEGGYDLRWEGAARVFQLERATAVEGPYFSVGGLSPDRSVRDAFSSNAAFYRVRQW